MKTTNIGYMGNPFTATSSDPSAQWPGPSGVEYLFDWSLWVGAKDPTAPTPELSHRVSDGTEWRPLSLDPVDHIYESYEGAAGGVRDQDDDRDGRIDEEFLNGEDDDGDGLIDEDFAAIGQLMESLEMRDDTPQAVGANYSEPHVPLGLMVRQRVFSFGATGANDFVGVEYEIVNESGHALDSVYVGFMVDQDVGPVAKQGYWFDDVPEPRLPQRDVVEVLTREDPRYDPGTDMDHRNGFCVQDVIRLRGFTMMDDDGDGGATPGASSFLLLGHTTDPRGFKAPRAVGFHSYRLIRPGRSFSQGGTPILDAERYFALASPVGVNQATGMITVNPPPANERDDYSSICSVGPFLSLQSGESIRVQVALAVQAIDYSLPVNDVSGRPNVERFSKLVDNALAAQKVFRGRYETAPRGVLAPSERGWETGLIAPPGQVLAFSDCHSESTFTGGKDVTDSAYVWFDFDCNACTGPKGMLARHWLVAGPPPSPRLVLTPGDRTVTLDWDNRSEVVPDRLSGRRDSTAYYPGSFNFWGYQVWRASNFKRPVASIGPTDDLWELVASLKLYDDVTPLVDSVDTDSDGLNDAVRLTAPVLLDRESGKRYYPRDVAPELNPVTGDTVFAHAARSYIDPVRGLVMIPDYKIPVYPIGRYRFTDNGLFNGFVYFYAVTAVDSTGSPGVGGTRGTLVQREGPPSARESEGVVPQAPIASVAGRNVFVVPNPYRGRASWDLNPSPADPTGTHVDFFNMPAGPWTLRVFTISGDLVQSLHSTDIQPNGKQQQETPEDGQATWNLLSRNGQDVASGVYLFSVESSAGVQRGKFVIIR